jgi:hypothetical protein
MSKCVGDNEDEIECGERQKAEREECEFCVLRTRNDDECRHHAQVPSSRLTG